MPKNKEAHIMERISKENYYLDIAQTVAARSTCLRRKFGAIIVSNDSIVSTGYNGAPRGRKNCSDIGSCMREDLNIPRGERYEMCRSSHAEQNAIIAAAAHPVHILHRKLHGEELIPVNAVLVDGRCGLVPGLTAL